ncbi:MAG: 30S ribosomal protein S18 [Anaplasmataceae bacterium]|nr:30S ribosomal protein S18 [Anaplasmataceae bacterium]
MRSNFKTNNNKKHHPRGIPSIVKMMDKKIGCVVCNINKKNNNDDEEGDIGDIGDISPWNIKLLKTFTSSGGRILSRRINNLCCKHQRKIAKSVKAARTMAILPYCDWA